mmetsp:Transcript_50144/g.92579  ORF Transcript_50144/g.92579 Transcript_50144/m.92579 type:complete len:204 (+) Transcript_50144:1605-2216(+)
MVYQTLYLTAASKSLSKLALGNWRTASWQAGIRRFTKSSSASSSPMNEAGGSLPASLIAALRADFKGSLSESPRTSIRGGAPLLASAKSIELITPSWSPVTKPMTRITCNSPAVTSNTASRGTSRSAQERTSAFLSTGLYGFSTKRSIGAKPFLKFSFDPPRKRRLPLKSSPMTSSAVLITCTSASAVALSIGVLAVGVCKLG